MGEVERLRPLELLAHPGHVLPDEVRFERIAGASLNLEQMGIDAAHQGDQPVAVVDDERTDGRTAGARDQRRHGDQGRPEELPHGSFLIVSSK
jgi:hypothetical protein